MTQVKNTELVEKAVITTDAIASSGKLNPAQSDKFIDYIVEETVLKDDARIVRFRNETLEIDKIGIGQRVALPKTEASDPQLRRGITTTKIVLQPREIIVPFEISDNFRENNIEGEAIEDTIIKLMAKRLSNNLESLYIGGDVLGEATIEANIRDGGSTSQYIRDSYLGLRDGWVRLGDSGHQVDGGGLPVGLNIFSLMLRNMPTKFRRNKTDLRFYMSPDLEQIYVEKLASRATVLGDKATEGITHTPFGVAIKSVPLMDFRPTVVQHVVLNSTTPTALRYPAITNVVVTPSDLGGIPTTPFIAVTDYAIVTSASGSTIARNGSGITDGATVKVTYSASPQIILTHKNNFIVGIGRDIRIEKDRDIFKGVNQYAITCKVDVQFEEADAIVKGSNISTTI